MVQPSRTCSIFLEKFSLCEKTKIANVKTTQPKRSPDGTRSPYSKVLEDSPSKKIVFSKYVVFGGTVNENFFSVSAKKVTSVHNNSGSRVAKHGIDEAPSCNLFGGSLAKRDYWQYARRDV